MALEGTIKDFGLPDIFQLIGLQRKTGLLTLRHDTEDVVVTFENGMVVMADSSTKRLEDRIGNVLVKQGKLSKERLEEALQTQKATLQRLGHVLVAHHFITPKDLKEALQVQVSQIVFRVFRWRDGEYHFAPTDSVDYDRENFNPMSADFILMEGIRMVDEWPIIEKKIPSMDIVLRQVVNASLIEVGASGGEEGGGAPSEAKRPVSSSAKIRLSSEEEKIYRLVDGNRTVQSIIDSAGMGEFDVCRTLFDLLNRNIISTVGRSVARRAAEGPQEEEGVASATPGYAILALVALLSIAGAATHAWSPFAVIGLPPFLGEPRELMLEGVTHARIERLDAAVRAFHLGHGSLPNTLEDLVSAGLVDRSYLKDPWARPFHYSPTAGGYLLSAVDDAGKKVPGTSLERALPAHGR
jgi:Domain of unknown function (DUF4388)